MKKTLVRFFGTSIILWALCMFGLPAQAHAQGAVAFQLSADTGNGPVRQTLPQVIHVMNYGSAEATNVTLTFTPPKGAKVDSACQIDHLPGGLRSYTCSVGAIGGGQTVDVPFSLSMTKPAQVEIAVDVTCNEGATAQTTLYVSIN